MTRHAKPATQTRSAGTPEEQPRQWEKKGPRQDKTRRDQKRPRDQAGQTCHNSKTQNHEQAAKGKSQASSAKSTSQPSSQTGPEGVVACPQKGFRVNSTAVLLTYQGVAGLGQWREFLSFVRGCQRTWGVWRWCATLEQSKTGKFHIHVMLQFQKEVDRQSTYFAFQGIRPNAGPNGKTGQDLCGQGFGRRNIQKSIGRLWTACQPSLLLAQFLRA